MSIILYQGNNLAVEGRSGAEYFCKLESNEAEAKDKRKHIYLRFFIQVNGQMKIFEQMFTLTRDTQDSQTAYGSEWALEDWTSWYTLRNVLNGLGYKLTDEPVSQYSGDNFVIQNWIDTLERTVLPVE